MSTDKTLFASGSDAALDALLSETRAREPEISEALTARILADAAQTAAGFAVRPEALRSAPVRKAPKPRALSARLADFLRALGGVPAAAAFCAALALGAATGAAAPRWTDQSMELAATTEEAPNLVSEAVALLAADDPMGGT